MRAVLLFDVETTGLDPTKDRVVEAAGYLWSVPHRTQFASFSFVVRRDANAAESTNRISVPLMQDHGVAPEEALALLATWFGRADAVVAHNAAFDSQFVPEPLRSSRPWICSCDDIEWPTTGSRALGPLALAMGLAVDGSDLHRASADVALLRRMFERLDDPATLLARALRPKVRVVANAPRSQNDTLKQHGFRWDPDRREWWKRMAAEDVASLPFQVSA